MPCVMLFYGNITENKMPITDSTKLLNLPESGQRNPKQVYIELTSGIWIRHKVPEGELELWIDGHLQQTWDGAPTMDWAIDGNTVCSMIAVGIGIGERKRAKAISELLK